MCTVGFTCVVRQVTCVGLGVRSDVWSRPMLDPSMVTLGKGVLLKKKSKMMASILQISIINVIGLQIFFETKIFAD